MTDDFDQTPEWAEKAAPTRLSDRHKYIATLLALGYSHKRISEIVEMSPNRVSTLANTAIMRAEVADQRKILAADLSTARAVPSLAREGMNIAAKIMRDESENSGLRARIALKMVEHEIGQPTKKIEHSGSLVKDMIQLLRGELQEESEAIEVESHEVQEQLPAPEKALDEWIKKQD